MQKIDGKRVVADCHIEIAARLSDGTLSYDY